MLTVDYGRLPWIALTLAVSFGVYGYPEEAGRSRCGGVARASRPASWRARAITSLIWRANGIWPSASHGPATALLLAGDGVVTAIPLLFFGAAARRLPLSALGLIQYLTPVLQFAVGVVIGHEQMSAGRWAGFALVWVALIVLIVDGLRNQRRTAADQHRVTAAVI